MRYLIIFFAFLHLSASSQSWCPPGATWLFHPTNPVVLGSDQIWYTGDTVVGGIEGQRLSRSGYYYTTGGQDIISWNIPTYLVTSFSDDVVSIWSSGDQAWDTLFWFGAEAGDHWRAPHGTEEIDGFVSVTLVDTLIIDDIPLRRLHVEQVCDEVEPWVNWSGEVIERVGYFTTFHFPPTCGTETTFWTLRCYYDDEIHYGLACASTVGFEETLSSMITIYPNPGSDHFFIDLPPGQHQLRIFDALGRSVMRTSITSERSVIDTGSLQPGLYHIHVVDQVGNSRSRVWIKE